MHLEVVNGATLLAVGVVLERTVAEVVFVIAVDRRREAYLSEELTLVVPLVAYHVFAQIVAGRGAAVRCLYVRDFDLEETHLDQGRKYSASAKVAVVGAPVGTSSEETMGKWVEGVDGIAARVMNL